MDRITFNSSKIRRAVPEMRCRAGQLLIFRNLLRWLIEHVFRGKEDKPLIRELLKKRSRMNEQKPEISGPH